jgi:hypothetical protein
VTVTHGMIVDATGCGAAGLLGVSCLKSFKGPFSLSSLSLGRAIRLGSGLGVTLVSEQGYFLQVTLKVPPLRFRTLPAFYGSVACPSFA